MLATPVAIVTQSSTLVAVLTGLILGCIALLLLLGWRAGKRESPWLWPVAGAINLAMVGAGVATASSGRIEGTGYVTGASLLALRLDLLSALALTLTGFIGWVILRYSYNYLEGDSGRPRYLRSMCLTLASVWVLCSTNNLLTLCLAWGMSDLALHGLLTFYPDRPAAMLAARKRLMTMVAANVLMLVVALLLYSSQHTLALDELERAAANGYSPTMSIAALCLVLAVILKCAQLPFHGWLLQVMEAPTPVSALLHAGIVNMGGLVLLRTHAILELSLPAQGLLTIVGCLTASAAALVMMTRISIKVMLAWSTVAQMGFMLLEIGLGAYPLALLHLVAHSLYKAHAFLSAGETVYVQRVLQITNRNGNNELAPRSGMAWLILILVMLVDGGFWSWSTSGPRSELLMTLILLAGLFPLAFNRQKGNTTRRFAHTVPRLLLVVAAYLAMHLVFAHLMPFSTVNAPGWLLGLVVGCFTATFVLQQALVSRPEGALSRWLHPRAFSGFYLDERFTRLTLNFWNAIPFVGLCPARKATALIGPVNEEHA